MKVETIIFPRLSSEWFCHLVSSYCEQLSDLFVHSTASPLGVGEEVEWKQETRAVDFPLGETVFV